MDGRQIEMIKDARERVARMLERVSPSLIRTAQDYERIARILAPSIQKIQRYHEMTRPMLEEVLRDQRIEVPTVVPAQKDTVPESPESHAVPLDDATCRKIAAYMHELLKKDGEVAGSTKQKTIVDLPPSALWEQISIDFKNDREIVVRCRESM